MLDSRQPDYASYLLRLRRDNTQGRWHASLQSTATQELYHFVDIDALFAFLIAQLAPDEDAATELQLP